MPYVVWFGEREFTLLCAMCNQKFVAPAHDVYKTCIKLIACILSSHYFWFSYRHKKLSVSSVHQRITGAKKEVTNWTSMGH